MIRFIIIIAFLYCFLGIISISFSQNPSPTTDLILREVFYDAVGGDDGLEWIEPYNRGN